jgi:hypothetical protein
MKMKQQKFKRGNLVKVDDDYTNAIYSKGWPFPKHKHKLAGKQVIIIGSYADQFGTNISSNDDNHSKFTVMCENGGRHSWLPEASLCFIENGGEHLIKKAQQKYQDAVKLHKDIKYIASVSKFDQVIKTLKDKLDLTKEEVRDENNN